MYNMAIQQSVNQLLNNATIATGLYTHLPEVQDKRARNKELASINKKIGSIIQSENRIENFIASEEFANAMENVPQDKMDEILDTYFPDNPELEKLRARKAELDPEYFAEREKRREGQVLTELQREGRKAAEAENMKAAAEQEEKRKQDELMVKVEEERKLQEKRDAILHEKPIIQPREVLKGYGI